MLTIQSNIKDVIQNRRMLRTVLLRLAT